jgi:hypothetical protein
VALRRPHLHARLESDAIIVDLQFDPAPLTRGPPTDWGELLQVYDDRDVFQCSPDELLAIDIHIL